MRPLKLLLIFAAAVYVGLLGLLDAAVDQPSATGLAWHLWFWSAACTLSACALEISLLGAWLWLRVTGKSPPEVVPLRLTMEERSQIDSLARQLALVMPAHREASTPEDAAAFASRLFRLLLLSPSASRLYVLFDSPLEDRVAELAVIASVRRQLAAAGIAEERLQVEEYREKPPRLRNKPGSLVLWMARHRSRYPYLFILDADSELPAPDPERPESCEVLERLLVALDRNPRVALIQAALRIDRARTAWGWYQAVNSHLACAYHGPLWQTFFAGECPSFGHNQIVRTKVLHQFAVNTLEYLSHDHCDSADLVGAGYFCVQSHAVLTLETGEESVWSYLRRELRWARGNSQWPVYLAKQRRVPLGPWVYLVRGIHHYLCPLAGVICLLCSVQLIHAGIPLVRPSGSAPATALLGLVGVSLMGPKVAAAPQARELLGCLAIGVVMTPALAIVQGLFYLLGAFGRRWTLRGPRNPEWTTAHVGAILRVFYPVALMGLLLWRLVENQTGGAAEWFVQATLACLVASPLTAVALSAPLLRSQP